MKILHIGDVVGTSGRKVLKKLLPRLIEQEKAEFTIVNVENAASGFGVTEKIAKSVLALGADVLTSGNHIFDKDSVIPYLNSEERIIRPINYPPGTAGRGYNICKSKAGISVSVVNASGRTFMDPLDCPFQGVEKILPEVSSASKIIIVDFHGEASSEKMAMGRCFDGRISAVIGTHTHVQTADEQVLPGGTAYITDSGMTGSFNSIIGMEMSGSMARMIKHLPVRLKPAKGDEKICGVLVDIDEKSGKAVSIKRIYQSINKG